MKFAILGCGYVSDAYSHTLDLHPDVEICGTYDLLPERAKSLAILCKTKPYESFEDLLNDSKAEAVINLTNPREHYSTTLACLEKGKHVYSEKPIGMTTEEAQKLVDVAKKNSCLLSTAPCSALSPASLTIKKALEDSLIGTVRLVYANFEDGYIAPSQEPWNWKNSFGAPWPAKDEFEIGCTYEHAGYFLSWLATWFGPAKAVTSFASCQIPDKGIPVDSMAPDFTCGCIEYANNVVVRATCGLVAPRDKSLIIVGDEGTLEIKNLRNDLGPIWHTPVKPSLKVARVRNLLNRVKNVLRPIFPAEVMDYIQVKEAQKLPLITSSGGLKNVSSSLDKRADFLRGPAELAAAVREQRPCKLPGELGVHMVEILEALQNPKAIATPLASSFSQLDV